MAKTPIKAKRRTSRRWRQFRLLLLVVMAAGIFYYWKPWMPFIQMRLPAAVMPAPAQALPSEKDAVTARKGTVYTVNGLALKALKTDGSVLWERKLSKPAAGVIPSYDGVIAMSADRKSLLKYSALGKLMGEVPAAGPYTGIYESAVGLLFEERNLRQYTWTDSAGNVLGTQQIPDEHLIKIAVDPESGDTVIATLKTDEGMLESALHRFDGSGRLTGARTFRDAVLVHMQFSGSQLVVVLDDRMISLDEQMKDRWTVQEPARYQAVGFGTETFWVVRAQAGIAEAQVLQCYNQDGKVLFSLPVNDRMSLLAIGEKEQAAVVTGQRLQVFTGKGVSNGELQLPKVPEKIVWLTQKQLLIFYGDSVSIESIDTRQIK